MNYLLMVMQECDALCVSATVASGASQQRIWTRDMAYTCGTQWHQSKKSFGGYNAPVRCAWLDADHSNGILSKGLSLHMQSFATDSALLAQYRKNQKWLCQNTRRMTFHPEIMADSLVARFDPPLEYNSQGGIKSPNRGTNRRPRAYPDGTFKKKRASKVLPRNVTESSIKGLKNNIPDLLIIRIQNRHSARELCGHPMSLGPNFVDIPRACFAVLRVCSVTSNPRPLEPRIQRSGRKSCGRGKYFS